MLVMVVFFIAFRWIHLSTPLIRLFLLRSEERFSRNAETDLVCRLLLEKKKIKDECSRLLEASTMKSRRGFAIQRLMNVMRQAHVDGCFIVFDSLTLSDDRLDAFYFFLNDLPAY